METVQSVALAAGLAWGSGLRLYAVLFAAGLLNRLGLLDLPQALQVLAHPWALGASGAMLALEFLADKIPVVDSVWDAVHSFIRIPAGAVLAASALGAHEPVIAVVAAILGGTLAAGTHAAKSGARALINTSPEPFSNGLASLFEDGLVVVVVWLATQYPLAFGIALAVMLLLSALLLVWLARFLKLVVRKLRGFFGHQVPGPTDARV